MLYGQVVVKVVPVSSPEVAEACKILENTYRAVNIALVNELKMLYDRMGIDIWEVIDAAKTKPFGFQAFYPGPGPGRALHPDRSVLPDLDGARVRRATRFIELAGEINTAHAALRRRSAGRALNDRGKPIKGSRSSCWAWPTRRTSTTRASRPAFEMMELLLKKGRRRHLQRPARPRIAEDAALPEPARHEQSAADAEFLESRIACYLHRSLGL